MIFTTCGNIIFCVIFYFIGQCTTLIWI